MPAIGKRKSKQRVCNFCHRRFIPDDARRIEQPCPYCGQVSRKTQTKSQLKARADWCFSRLVRFLRSDRRGYVTCCTCGQSRRWQDVDAGHYMSRTFKATQWDLDNVWPQCPMCNTGYGARKWTPNESVKQRYTAFLRATLGEDAPDRLHAKAIAGRGWSVTELRELVQNLEAQCEEHGLL